MYKNNYKINEITALEVYYNAGVYRQHNVYVTEYR